MNDPDYVEGAVFVRKPFIVEAVQVTKDNLEQIATYLGHVGKDEDGKNCIEIDNNRVPNISRVYPGYWVTKMGNNIRCYAGKIFREQFVPSTPEILNWVEFMNNREPGAPVLKINVS